MDAQIEFVTNHNLVTEGFFKNDYKGLRIIRYSIKIALSFSYST